MPVDGSNTTPLSWSAKLTDAASSAWAAFRQWRLRWQVFGWVLGWWILGAIVAWKSRLPVVAKVALTALIAFCVLLAVKGSETSSAHEAVAPPPVTRAPPPSGRPVDPSDRLERSLEAALGESNRGVAKRAQVSVFNENVIMLTFAVDSNLTNDMTKLGARLDTSKILKVLKDLGRPDGGEVRIRATYPLVDKLGNASETVVFDGSYAMATINRINFDGFLSENSWDIADSAGVHEAFR